MGRAARVVVVGAGPAGAVTALLLARAGHDVVVLDRASFPRPKPCGDCMSPGAGPVLARLGLLERVEGARPARLTGWRVVGLGGTVLDAGLGDLAADPAARAGLALPRARLDALLVEAAVEAGARLLERHHAISPLRDGRGWVTGVRARAPGGEGVEVRGDLLVVADGLRSSLGRRLGLAGPPGPLRKVSLTAHVPGVRGDGATGELHLGDGLCAGLAPVAATGGADGPAEAAAPSTLAWNVTVVASTARHGEAIRRDAQAFFRAALEGLPAVRGRVPSGSAGALLASGPFQRPVRRLAVDGAALVGDAAGYFDPFTGQGIYHALAGAERLAEVADRALRGDGASAAALRGYAAGHRRVLAEAHLLQRGVDAVVSHPRWCDAALRRLRRSPRLAERLLATTGDLARARSLLSPSTLLALLTSGSGTP